MRRTGKEREGRLIVNANATRTHATKSKRISIKLFGDGPTLATFFAAICPGPTPSGRFGWLTGRYFHGHPRASSARAIRSSGLSCGTCRMRRMASSKWPWRRNDMAMHISDAAPESLGRHGHCVPQISRMLHHVQDSQKGPNGSSSLRHPSAEVPAGATQLPIVLLLAAIDATRHFIRGFAAAAWTQGGRIRSDRPTHPSKAKRSQRRAVQANDRSLIVILSEHIAARGLGGSIRT